METLSIALPALSEAIGLITQPIVLAYLVLGVVMGLSIGVFPIAPDEAAYPKSLENTLLTFLVFAGIYLMLSMTVAILREQVSACPHDTCRNRAGHLRPGPAADGDRGPLPAGKP